jgi:hypothetical protein
MNSRQSHAPQGFAERSDVFRKYTVLQKTRRFKTVKNTFLTVLGGRFCARPFFYLHSFLCGVASAAARGYNIFRQGGAQFWIA